jgi:hypothetical protein
VADNIDELEGISFGEDFGRITDMEVGPDGYLYVLSLRQSGDNCIPAETSPDKDCVEYNSGVRGVIFGIIPNKS